MSRLNKYVIKVVNKIVVKIELRKLIVYCYFVFFVEIEELLKNYLIIINNIFFKELIFNCLLCKIFENICMMYIFIMIIVN